MAMSPEHRERVCWRVFWGLLLLAIALLDAWREDKDIEAGRTHSTGTTLSSGVRWAVESVPGGRRIFAALCVLIPRWFYNHILNHLDSRAAEW